MKIAKVFFSVLLIFLIIFPTSYSEDDSKKSSTTNLADKLVNQCTNIQENDIVLLTGGIKNVELLEDLAINVRKVGAFPIVTLGSDRMNKLYFDEVPAKYDSQKPEHDMQMAKIINASIYISYNENSSLFSDIPPERFAAISTAYIPVNELYLNRNIKQVSLGNGLYPTIDLAKRFDVPIEKLSKIFWDGVNVNYLELQNIGKSYQSKLAKGKEILITNPNGTNFRVKIKDRPVLLSDGVICEKDLEKGGASCQVWLPAGEVFLAPIPGTAEGKIVVDRQFYIGNEITNLVLVFEKGKLISMDADSDIKTLKDIYEISNEGKEDFAFIDIGINPNVILVPNSRMVAWMASGMITVGIGGNTWAGGQNQSNFNLTNFIPGSTLKIDDEILVENGELKL